MLKIIPIDYKITKISNQWEKQEGGDNMNEEDQQNAYDDIYGGSNKGGKSGLDKAADAGKKAADAGKKAAKAAKHAAKLGKLFATPVGWVILGIIGVILLIFLIIGAISFLQTMPGLILGKLEELAYCFATAIETAFTGNDVDAQIREEDIVELAQYVKDMGYDLYTMGFGMPEFEKDENGNETTQIKTMNENYASPLYRYVFANLRTYTKRSDAMELNFANVIIKAIPVTNIASFISKAIVADHWNGQGMLYIHEGAISNSSIDIEKKELTMTRYQGGLSFAWNDYVYSLDGWTGRYGMPLSFSLALHLSTMKPDLVTTIIEEFDTTVNIDQKKTSIDIELSYIDEDGNEYSIDNAPLNSDDIENIKKQFTTEDAAIYQPYITTVENHWYYKTIDFSNAYEDTDDYSQDYQSDNSTVNKILTDAGKTGKVWVHETSHGNSTRKKQVRQPEIEEGANEKIKEIFKGKSDEEPAKYYTYDGTIKTADAIEEARKNGDDSLKKPVAFEKKDALEAFSILENAKDLDSQYVYRDLKKLLIELEYFTEEDFEKPDTQVLKWILSGYKPPKWPQREDEYSHGAILYSKATKDKGFEAEKSVTSPGKGIVSKISEDSITIKFTEPEVVLDFSIKISGFAVNQELKEGDSIEQGAEIGKTTDSDIRMILKDAKGSIIDHIGDYINYEKKSSVGGNNIINTSNPSAGALLQVASTIHEQQTDWSYSGGSGLTWGDIEQALNNPAKATCCATFVSTVLWKAGYFTTEEMNTFNYNYCPTLYDFLVSHGWQTIHSYDALEPGDVVFSGGDSGFGHVNIFAEAPDGFYDAGSDYSIHMSGIFYQGDYIRNSFTLAMRPPYLSPITAIDDDDYAMFYWTPYESGGWDNRDEGPEIVGGISNTEKGAGIAQWTTLESFNNIGELMKYAYRANPSLCAEFSQYINMTGSQVVADINLGESSGIKNAFRAICARDRSEFLKIQIAKKKEELAQNASYYDAEWILDTPPIVQGTIMAMWNYGAGLWPRTKHLSPNNSDLENLKIAMGKSAYTGSTVGSLHERFESQFALARDILAGVVSEGELEEWVRKGGQNMPQYANGRNPGVLSGYMYR